MPYLAFLRDWRRVHSGRWSDGGGRRAFAGGSRGRQISASSGAGETSLERGGRKLSWERQLSEAREHKSELVGEAHPDNVSYDSPPEYDEHDSDRDNRDFDYDL